MATGKELFIVSYVGRRGNARPGTSRGLLGATAGRSTTNRDPNDFGVDVGVPARLCAVAVSAGNRAKEGTRSSRPQGQESRWWEYEKTKRERKQSLRAAWLLRTFCATGRSRVLTPGTFLISSRGSTDFHRTGVAKRSAASC